MTSRHVNSITGRLSLRSPQRRSLEILDRVMEIAQPHKGGDLKSALDVIRSEFATVEDFEHAFPSLCFALATGVGKTRLMGAFITYLHLEYGIRHFFVLAPNLTIYNKLVADFTPNTPKYVFQGIAEFAVKAPTLVTGENFEQKPQVLDLFERDDVVVNIFNISKFNEKTKGTDEEGKKTLKVRRLSEFLGQSYFDYLAGLDDLVLIMDEAHRYRADTSAKSIDELKPVLGLELTATGEGNCHGCLQWCVFCGDVGDVCDVREWPQRCDCHGRYPPRPEPDPNQLLLFEDEVSPGMCVHRMELRLERLL